MTCNVNMLGTLGKNYFNARLELLSDFGLDRARGLEPMTSSMTPDGDFLLETRTRMPACWTILLCLGNSNAFG